MTTKFLRGLIQAWIWACANPRAAVTNARTHFPAPVYDYEAGVNIWKETCTLLRTKAAKGRLLGYTALEDWKRHGRSRPQRSGARRDAERAPRGDAVHDEFVQRAWSTMKPKPKKKGGG